MPEAPPKGIFPIFLRGVTCEKYGMKIGEGINDLVDFIELNKDDILKEVQGLGVMSDFERAKKSIEKKLKDLEINSIGGKNSPAYKFYSDRLNKLNEKYGRYAQESGAGEFDSRTFGVK